jgi:hypothetical protein
MSNFQASDPDDPELNNELQELVQAGAQCLEGCGANAFVTADFDPKVSTLFVDGLFAVDSVARADRVALSVSPDQKLNLDFGSRDAALLTFLCSRQPERVLQFLRFIERTLASRGVALLHVRAVPDSANLFQRAGYRSWVPGMPTPTRAPSGLRLRFAEFGDAEILTKTLSFARRRATTTTTATVAGTRAAGCGRRTPPSPRPSCAQT